MTVTDQVLGPLLASDPNRPRITHYDDAAGSRVELSGATLGNWAAKTANWLRDELDVQPGDPVAVLLPPHWQTAGVLLGAWWVGARVSTSEMGAERSDVVFCGVNRLAEPPSGSVAELVAVGLDPLGAPVGDLPPGVHDYASEIRAHADTFRSTRGGPLVAEFVAAARARAQTLGLNAGDRLLCTAGWDGNVPGELLLAVLAADAGLVQCTGSDPAILPDRVKAERVSVTVP